MNIHKNMNSVPIGISLPIELVKKIDKERHDVPRSRYILRLIENGVYTINKGVGA
jgi:metal-responsive CopG/Arc/MetJ family transcriptional regulator